MKLSLHAVGRMKKGPERELFSRYWERSISVGKSQGFTAFTIKEHSESKASRPADRMAQEAAAILPDINKSTLLVALDERGKTMTSTDFAQCLARYRDEAMGDVVFVIGGADGLDQKLRTRADKLICFGAMTWPHQLVRVLLAEQIYRAVSILSGHPYHKV